MADRVRELAIIHRLGDVDAAAELVAPRHLASVVGGGQDDHRDASRSLFGLHALEHLVAIEHRQVQIQKHQQR